LPNQKYHCLPNFESYHGLASRINETHLTCFKLFENKAHIKRYEKFCKGLVFAFFQVEVLVFQNETGQENEAIHNQTITFSS